MLDGHGDNRSMREVDLGFELSSILRDFVTFDLLVLADVAIDVGLDECAITT